MTFTAMIACVTTETVMVSDPVIRMLPDEVHIYRYVRDPGTPKAQLYEDHYRETVRQILEGYPCCEIVEHKGTPIYDYAKMAASLQRVNTRILAQHPDAKVLVNISSGPNQYSAAAGVFQCTNPNVTLFSVSTEDYWMDVEDFISKNYVDGRPTGLSRSVHAPKMIEGVHLDQPDETLVRGLRVYAGAVKQGIVPYSSAIMPLLEKAGLMRLNRKGSSDKVTYHRNFVRPWIILGWITDDGSRIHDLTDQGKMVIALYHLD